MKKIICSLIVIISINSFAQKRKAFPTEKPQLVIGIVVEQMRYDYIYRYWDKFGEGGFQRLVNEGTFCKNTKYNYMLTQSAPGFATIATGAQPASHGIISDNWYVRLKNEMTYCVSDQETMSVGGNEMYGNYSPSLLRSTTLGDEMQLSNFNQSKIVSVSLDAKAAVLMSGHVKSQAYWFDNISGDFMSSSFYVDSLPIWVNKFNEKQFPHMYMQRTWEPILPSGDYTESLDDRNDYELGFGGSTTFPYILYPDKRKNMDFAMLNKTPFGNTLTKDFAISAIVEEELGADEYSDLLMISFASLQHIGEKFGPLSMEMQDAYLRLDKELEHFLTFIDEQVGKERTLVFLTSNHGTSYTPEYLNDLGYEVKKFNPIPAMSLLKSYLGVVYGSGNWLRGYDKGQIYLNQSLIEDSKIPLEEIQRRVANFMIQFSGVSNAVAATSLSTSNFTNGIFQKMQNSYDQKRSGDVIVSLEPGWIQWTDDVTGNNSMYSYDVHVPLIWYGWKMKRSTITLPIDPADIAPTISMFLNISLPNSASGKPIQDLIE